MSADLLTLDNYRRVRAAIALMARTDPDVFISYVLKDEGTGGPVHQSSMHCEWQSMISSNTRAVIIAHLESGKTQQLSIGRVLYELGRDPTTRILVVSATSDNASKIAGALQKYIARSYELRDVFPNLRPGTPWTAGAFSVERPGVQKDYSVQVCGVGGHVLGARYDLVVFDDVLDWENTRTAYQREKVESWVTSMVLGRLTARGRAIAVGNPWHPEDLLHTFAKRGWASARYSVLYDDGASRWPERWPLSRVAEFRETNPLQYARQLLCVARDDSESRFKREWIDRCKAAALAKGITGFIDRWAPMPGVFTITGVDLAVSDKNSAAKTVLFTLVVYPDGLRQVAEIQSGRWTGPEIIEKVRDVHERYGSVVYVESNAAQTYLVQFTNALGAGPPIPVKPFHTGLNKHNPAFGVESIAVELSQGKWLIPCAPGGKLHPETAAWVDQMLYYAPSAHTGDALMASWIAREGARTAGPIKRVFIDTQRR